MLKKAMLLIVSGMLMLNLSGCFLFVAGVVGGAGTAVWLSGKLTQEFHSSYQTTIDATKQALETLNLSVISQKQDENVTQFKGSYRDGSEMWIDVRRVSDHSTKVEVRVGGVTSNKDADSEILKKIQDYLY